MKFLIQKCNGEVRHDFAFTLLESIRFKKWLTNTNDIKVKFVNTDPDADSIEHVRPCPFKEIHRNYVPIGSVEFVSFFLQKFYGLTPKPINVPEELFKHPSFDFINTNYTKRQICNGNHMDLEDVAGGKYFVKSNDKIKGFQQVIELKTRGALPLPAGNYQVSQYINGIQSEWRAFVYEGKLVGLQNYSGDFTKFPSVGKINEMIKAYKSAPIAYTLDIGVGDEIYDEKYGFHLWNETFVIEAHDFFGCGLYGFADHAILPNMFYKWFWQYIQKEMVEQRREKL